MKTTHALLASAFLTLAGVSRAQVITVNDDLASWTGSVETFGGTGQNFISEGEAFTNVLALESVEYTFLSTALTSNAAGTLNATLVELGSNSGTKFSYTTVANLGTINVPAPSTWESNANGGSLTYGSITAYTYNASIDLSFTNLENLNPDATYVVLLTNTGSAATSFGLGLIQNGVNDPSNTLDNNFYSTGNVSYPLTDEGLDWTFQSIEVIPGGNVIPVPEPRTVAALAGCALAAGLVLFRLRQRRNGMNAGFELPAAAV